MHDGLVRAAGLGVAVADREVDGAADLLVEEDRADRAVDAEVGADAELAEEARAGVRVERGLQVGVAALGAWRSTTRPSRNSSVTSSTTTPRGAVGIVKRIDALRGVLVRRR